MVELRLIGERNPLRGRNPARRAGRNRHVVPTKSAPVERTGAAISLTVFPRVKHYPWSGKMICYCRLGTKSASRTKSCPVGRTKSPRWRGRNPTFGRTGAAISLTVFPRVKHYPWSGKMICYCRLGTKSGRCPTSRRCLTTALAWQAKSDLRSDGGREKFANRAPRDVMTMSHHWKTYHGVYCGLRRVFRLVFLAWGGGGAWEAGVPRRLRQQRW